VSHYYPIMLNMRGKKAIVVGGGNIATRKVETLLRADADVYVISPTVTQRLEAMSNAKQIVWINKPFDKSDLQRAFLVIAATHSKELNERIIEMSFPDQLVSSAHHNEASDFIVPASIERGKLSITVSTDGASPGLSKKIIKELSEQYDDAYTDYVHFLGEARYLVQAQVDDQALRAQILNELLDPVYLEWSRQGKWEHLKQRLHDLIQNTK